MKSRRSSWLLLALLGVCAPLSIMWAAGPEEAATALFTGPVRRVEISIEPEHVEALRLSPREYVPATVREGTNVWPRVGIHLKGAVGSFRTIDGKPGLTLNFEKFGGGERFHGLRKIHLNNSVEDASCLHDLIGSELFAAAGVPSARGTHAIVTLNGRRLGTYVLKEGYTEDFLARFFQRTGGNLYDLTPNAHDVDQPMEKDLGRNPDDRSDLEMLAAAALESDAARRWARLGQILDVDRFISFMAMEILTGHRDGYSLARNNFRVYHDVDKGRLLFIPHGMDVLFGNARAPIEPRMNGLVARAVAETPESRRLYRERLGTLATNVLVTAKLQARVDALTARLAAALPTNEAAVISRESAALKARIDARIAQVHQQLAEPPLEPLRFENDAARPTHWKGVDVPEGGALVQTNAEGRACLLIRAGPITAASWRAKVILPPGRFRFEGDLMTRAVEPLPFGKNHGATLRVTEADADRAAPLLGSRAWSNRGVEFTLSEEQEMELVCEMRARRGEAWFDIASLRVIRLTDTKKTPTGN